LSLQASIEIGLDTSIPQGLEDAIKSLKAGEKCEVQIQPSHGYGIEGEPSLNIPPGAELTGTVELHSFKKGTDKWAMNQAEKISYAEKRKNIGNDLFKKGNLSRSIKMYQAALSHVEFEKDLPAEGNALFAIIHSNVAAVHLKKNDFQEAIKSCDSAFKKDPGHVKSLFRRAQAHIGLGAPEDAIGDLSKALQLDPRNAAVKALLTKCKNAMKAQIAKERRTFGGIFERLSKAEESEAAKAEHLTETKAADRMETEPVVADA